MVADGNSSKEYPVNNGFSAGSIPVLTLFQLYINDLPDDVICNINVYINNTALYSKYERHLVCGSNWKIILNLNLTYETL